MRGAAQRNGSTPFDCSSNVATHLTRIDFTTCSTRQHLPIPTSVFSPIQQLKFLRVISLRMSSDIDIESLRSVLFGMRSLEAVNFVGWRITDHLVDPGPQLGTPGLTPVNLRTLRRKPRMFYHVFSAPYLRVLRNHFHRSGAVGESVAAFCSIAQCFPCLQELQLVMDFAPRGRRAPEESLSLGSVMRPLSKLRALVSVTVEVRGLLDTSTDADMIVLAEAFPLLTTLQIHCRPLLAVPSLSAAVLASFASRCPKLETLSLPSMHVVERDLSLLANYPALDHGLRSLHFSTLDSADGHFTALLLDRLFPRMEITGFRPKPSFDEPSSSQGTWAHICDILETLQIARRQHERCQSVVSWSAVP